MTSQQIYFQFFIFNFEIFFYFSTITYYITSFHQKNPFIFQKILYSIHILNSKFKIFQNSIFPTLLMSFKMVLYPFLYFAFCTVFVALKNKDIYGLYSTQYLCIVWFNDMIYILYGMDKHS